LGHARCGSRRDFESSVKNGVLKLVSPTAVPLYQDSVAKLKGLLKNDVALHGSACLSTTTFTLFSISEILARNQYYSEHKEGGTCYSLKGK
jgi:hypothetical protein